MRVRLPVLILAGVLGLVVLFSFAGPRRLGDIILRRPIVLLQQAAARILGIFVRTATATPEAVQSPAAPSDQPTADQPTRVLKTAPASNPPVQTGAPRRAPGRQPEGEVAARSVSSPERLRAENTGVTPRGNQLLIPGQSAPGFELANDTVAGTPSLPTGVEPPAPAQPPVGLQPPTDLQPPSGIIPPGLQPLIDSLVPPGGILAPGLLAGVLPAGTVISPGGLAQLPGGIQVQLPSGTQPGQIQIGPVQVGPAQSGSIQIGPIQIGSGQPGSGQPGSGQPGSGPVQGGPIQIGPIQISPP